MIRPIPRRQFLRVAGAGSLTFSAGWLPGCNRDSDALEDAGMGASPDAGWAGAPDAGDGHLPWWLRGNYGPVPDEIEAVELTVHGSLPPELSGLYVRNGSNPQHADSGHWFLGDGMLHGVHLQGGQASWYRNRYIQTPQLAGMASGIPGGANTASNVSLVHHAGRLLTLGEVGYPYHIDASDLSTVGAYDFGGALTTNMTAHPKIDPVTGEMVFFGYNFLAPYLTYHLANAQGELIKSEPIELPAGVMMHDFAITETRAIFMDLPIRFDLQAAMGGSSFPFAWSHEHVARLGVMPRDGGNEDVVWIEIPACYVFHVMNAYDVPGEPDRLVLEAVRYPELWVDGPDDLEGNGELYRWTIDLATGSTQGEAIDDRRMEFPRVDERRTGRPYRYGYGVGLRAPGDDGPGHSYAYLKVDHQSGAQSAHEFASHRRPDEAVFIPAGPNAGEDEGWLMGYVFDARENRSELVILDASDMTADPVARVELPRRVPFGFHGVWVPDTET